MPVRHGVPWEAEEFFQLIREVEEGLALLRIAKRHQRTLGGISGAATRLIPPQLRPKNRSGSVEILARYLRETADVDRRALVLAVRPGAVVCSVAKHPPRQRRVPERECSGMALHASDDAPARCSTDAMKFGDSMRHVDLSDALMLVSAALASLPNERDRNVLEMRLGADGQSLTLAAIGAQRGISRERVRQVQESAFRKLAARARKAESPGAILRELLDDTCNSAEELAKCLLEAANSGFDASPGLVSRFILHAAGFRKEVTTEILALQSAIEESLKARQRQLARDHAAANRADCTIDKWLEYSDWPDELAVPPPIGDLSAQRRVNDSDVAGSFYSAKLGRIVSYESGLELGVLTLLERSGQVAYYQEQPVLISYSAGSRKRKYYPDLLVAMSDGRCLLIEVKPTESMALSINRTKASAGRAWAHACGWGWLVVSDRLTFRHLEEYVIAPAAWSLLDRELRERGVLTWRDRLDLRLQHGLTRLDITAYIIQSGAELDRAYRITAGKS